jgi:hypothetical protein
MRNHLGIVVPFGQLPADRVTAVAGGQAEVRPAGEASLLMAMPPPALCGRYRPVR